ncbi:hypothetical protein A2U01_0057631, partial [Trifolium medium]|nr:hypothetical protein [Trifolium medium]
EKFINRASPIRLNHIHSSANYPQFNMDSPTTVLDSPHVKTIKHLKRLLRYDVDDLLEQVNDFTAFAKDLQAYSWRLNNKEQRFMEAVMHFQGELASDAPFIEAVENAHSCHH